MTMLNRANAGGRRRAHQGNETMCPPPLRVLQIASTSAIGGAEQMIMHYIRHADPARVTPEVLSLMGPGHLTLLAMQAGVKATNWALPRLANPLLLRRMRHFMRAGHFNLVHCYGLRAELLARWVAHGLGMPLISGVHSIDAHRRRHHVWLDRMTADGVTAWVAVCEAARQARIAREGVPPDRIHVVPNGIPDLPPPDAEARARERARLGLNPTAPVLVVIANLRAAKGYPDLIEAIARLRQERPDLVCLCAGRDDEGGRNQRLAEARGVAPAMRFLGYVGEPQGLLAAADALVLASHWEGSPVTILEAMRARRAIVATAVGGVPELIEDGRHGLLVAAHQPEALAAAIGRLLAEPGLGARLGEAARERFLEQFTVGRMVERMSEIYERYALAMPI